MSTLEKKKYLEPKFTTCVSDLARYFNINKSPSVSEMESESSIERTYTNSYYKYVNNQKKQPKPNTPTFSVSSE